MSRLERSKLFAAASKLAFGSVIGYLVVVLLTPVLTRVYTPADLGAFSVIAACVGVLPPILAFGYPLGQLSAKTRTGTVRFATTALVIAVLASMILLVTGFSLAALTETPELFSGAVLFSVTCSLIAVITSVAINWSIREGREGSAAAATFLNLGGRAVFQVGFGIAVGGVKGLIFGELAGRLAAWAAAERGLCRAAFRRGTSQFRRVLRHAIRERGYPTVVTPALTAENLLVWLPAPVFGIVFGAEIGGLVALVQRFVSVPLTIANQSLATLFHREFAARSASQAVRIVNALIMMALVVGLISLPLSAGALWYGSGIASRLFGGDEWSGVAIVAAAFVPVCAAQFICLFTDRILLVMGRSDLKLVFLVSALLMMPVTLALAKSIGLSWEAAIWTYAASQTIIYLLMFFSVIRVLRNQRDPVAHNEG